MTQEKPQPKADRRPAPAPKLASWWPYLGIGLLALILRLIFIAELNATEYADALMGDALSYDRWGQRIAAGDWRGDTIFYQAPLYPYFLGSIYSLLGHSLTAVRIIQAILGGLSAVLLALAGRHLFSRHAGLLAGLILALYPTAIFFDGTLQKTGLALFLSTALLFCLGWLVARPGARAAVATGVVLGLLALVRENALILIPGVAIWSLWFFGRLSWRRRGAWAVILLGGAALVLLPVAARNLAVGGELKITTSQLGSNFYIGNNPNANGAYMPLMAGKGDPTFERGDAVFLAELESGRRLSPGEVSRFWLEKGLAFVKSQPGRWLRLAGHKAALAFNATEMSDTEDQYTYAEWSQVLKLPGWLLHWGTLWPLSILGLVLTWPHRRRLSILYLLFLVYALTLIVFFVIGRYRIPLVPIVILFGASALISLKDLWRGVRPPKKLLTIGVVAALLAAVAANWPLVDKNYFRMVMHCNIATAMLEEGGREREALAHLQTAMRIDPDYANAHHLMGVTLNRLGEAGEGEVHLRRAIRLDPERALTYFKLAELQLAQGRPAEAVDHLRQGLSRDPTSIEARNNLAMLLARMGRFDEALEQSERALVLAPDDLTLRVNHARVLSDAGRYEQAEQAFRWVLERAPENPRARLGIADAYVAMGRPQRAVAEYESALALNPQDFAAATRLAWLLATSAEDAVRDGARALELAGNANRLTGGSFPIVLDVLAAAYAETGDLTRACAEAERALRGAREAGQEGFAGQVAERLAAYRSGRAWREPAP
jgi:tetratricopeptide (TPR) repeat protein/4-amino-4-deoxy-L-arabinose transferase-like glycosyltransferase